MPTVDPVHAASPRTLRQHAGLPDRPAALAQSALVIVDAQNTYLRGNMRLQDVDAALQAVASVLRTAREHGVPVFHVQHDGGPGSDYDIRDTIGAIADAVAPIEGEAVIVKKLPNSFVGTDLQAQLQASGRTHLVVVGFMTHMCINSTARGAFNLGWPVTVVASATATRDLPGPDGRVVPAAQMQAAALAALGDLFAVVCEDERAWLAGSEQR